MMKNPLTFRVESSLGAVFVSLLALFFIGLLFIAIKNFESDIDIMAVGYNDTKVRKVSRAELVLLQDWIKFNKVELLKGQGYNYIVRKYPDKPWLD